MMGKLKGCISDTIKYKLPVVVLILVLIISGVASAATPSIGQNNGGAGLVQSSNPPDITNIDKSLIDLDLLAPQETFPIGTSPDMQAPQDVSQISASVPWSVSSPNGKYSISVTDEGISLDIPGGGIVLNENAININATTAQININGALPVNIKSGAIVNINGTIIKLNNGSLPAARVGDNVTSNTTRAANKITTGSATVLIGN